MRRLKTLSILALAGATTGFACLQVATPPYVYASSAASATPDQPDIDPDAMAALDKMGAYLRTLKAFQVQASVTAEDVLEDGQKIQYQTATNLLAETPSRLRVEVTGARQHRLYLYDGKTVTKPSLPFT